MIAFYAGFRTFDHFSGGPQMKFHRPLALMATATATFSTWASADVVTSSYLSSSEYEFEIDDMPDFDQVRDTLGVDGNGDPGGMFCVPTSTGEPAWLHRHTRL